MKEISGGWKIDQFFLKFGYVFFMLLGDRFDFKIFYLEKISKF